jgi:hypothetical protein
MMEAIVLPTPAQELVHHRAASAFCKLAVDFSTIKGFAKAALMSWEGAGLRNPDLSDEDKLDKVMTAEAAVIVLRERLPETSTTLRQKLTRDLEILRKREIAIRLQLAEYGTADYLDAEKQAAFQRLSYETDNAELCRYLELLSFAQAEHFN